MQGQSGIMILYVLVLSGALISKTMSKSEASESDDVLRDKIDRFTKQMIDCCSNPGLALSVVKSGRTIISKGYGFSRSPPKDGSTSDDVKNTAITSKTKFAIGSLSKAFTGLLAIKVVVDSNLSITLDTPIQSYLPDFQVSDEVRSSQATLRDLLSHRMSMPGYTLPLMMGFSPSVSRQEFIKRMAFLPSPLSFRDKIIYNNYMYTLVDFVLGGLTGGQSWEDLVRDYIFRPLNMSDSGFVTDVKDFHDFALACYRDDDDAFVDAIPDLFNTAYPFGPAGTIYSTSDDMIRWMNLMLTKSQRPSPPGLDPEMIQETFKGGSLSPLPFYDMFIPEYPVSHQSLYYGAGWAAGVYRGYKHIFHSGGIVTHSSRLWLFPDLDIGIFITTRGPQDNKKIMLKYIMYYVSDLMIGVEPWFNVSSGCDDPIPWKTSDSESENAFTKLNNAELMKKLKKIFATNYNKLNDPTISFDPNLYTGNYSHPFFGTVQIFSECNSTFDYDLCMNYGRYGWIVLLYKSNTTFNGRFHGPLKLFNPPFDWDIEVEFQFDYLFESILSLDLKYSADEYPYHFNKTDVSVSSVSEPGHSTSQGNILSPMLSFSVYIVVIHILCIFLESL